MRKLVNEFKAFISRGNVVDLAVGIIMGTAFTAIINSLVKEVVMPFIGLLIQGVNFTDLKWVLVPAQGEIAEIAVLYGNFLQQIISFFAIALVVFAIVRAMNSFRKKEEQATAPPPETPEEIVLLREIRDSVKK